MTVPPSLQFLLDRAEIEDLLTRYMRAIDRGDVATLRACYLAEATEEHGGIYTGSAQGYIDSIADALTHPRAVSTHTITNLLIDLDGDSARSEHYVLAMTRARADGGVVKDSLVASRIVDDLRREDGRWGIARRRLRFDWAHDLGSRPQRWLYGRLDPAALLHGAKYPDDVIYQAGRRPGNETDEDGTGA